MTKQTGTKYEYQLKAKLLKLPNTLAVIRSAGSHGQSDITHILRDRVRLFEVKSTAKDKYYLSKDSKQSANLKALLQKPVEYPLEIYYAVKFLNSGWEFFPLLPEMKKCEINGGLTWEEAFLS